jgi:hypothetical protein
MSEQNTANENVIEVPVTEAVAQSTNQGLLNLEDVAYMIMVGRTKDGETFFRTVGISDLIHIRGLVDYANDEVKHEFDKYFATIKGNPLEEKIAKLEETIKELSEKLK